MYGKVIRQPLPALSSSNVTGPSLTSQTCISAPKRPVCTATPARVEPRSGLVEACEGHFRESVAADKEDVPNRRVEIVGSLHVADVTDARQDDESRVGDS